MATPYHSQCSQIRRYRLLLCTFFTNCKQIRNISPFLISLALLDSFPPGEAMVRCLTFRRGKDGKCRFSNAAKIPSPGGKGDREAVDEEWRHLTIRNAVKSGGTGFSFVPFSRTANKFGTFRRSSSVSLCSTASPRGKLWCDV